MDDIENALTDRLRKTLGSTPLPPTAAGARAEAERRLHAAWLAETARQTAKVEAAPTATPSPTVAAPVPQVETPDPRLAILGQSWETQPSAPEARSSAPASAAPPVEDWTSAQRAGNAAPEAEWVRPRAWSEAMVEPQPAQPQYVAAPQPQYVQQQPQYAQPQYAQPQYAQPQYAQPQYAQPQHAQPQHAQPQHAQPQHAQPHYAQPQHAQPQYAQPQYAQPQHAQPQHAQPQHAQQSPQPFTPVAPQRAPSFPPSDDAVTLRGGPVENLEFARMRVEELRKLQEWRLGQERRISEEIGRRNALAEAALDDELQARREAEEHRLEQWKAEARAQFERDLAREEAEFERRLADRRREAEVQLEARLLRRIDDAARRAEALEKGSSSAPETDKPTDPLLYVVRSAG